MNAFFIHKLKNPKKRIFSLLILIIYVMTMMAFSVSASGNNDQNIASNAITQQSVRVGLYYSNNALPTANLQNYVGSGFAFGYYDDKESFIELGRTAKTAITMAKDKNLYINDSTYSEVSGGTLLGAYHVQLKKQFSTFAEAQSEASKYSLAFPAYVKGSYRVRIDYFSTYAYAQAAAAQYTDAEVVGNSITCITVCSLGTNDILFEYDPGVTRTFAVAPLSDGTGECITWFKNRKYYGSFEYVRVNGNDITVINNVSLDHYAEGVIAYEMDPEWHIEALKAQALCAKSYALSCKTHSYFDVCNTTCCQVYNGVYTGSDAYNVIKAVSETSGEAIYYNGEPIRAYFHSSDGGATESAENAYGIDYPYAQGVIDDYEALSGNPNSSWVYYLSASEISTILNNRGYANSGIADVEVTKKTATGNVKVLTFTTTAGGKITVTGDSIRSIFESSSAGRYFSRRFIVLSPGESYDSGSAAGNGISISVNGQEAKTGSYAAIGYDGTAEFGSSVCILDGSGVVNTITEYDSSTSEASGKIYSYDKFTFIGSGWGHNVGMSQFGAKAMAELGYTYKEIINFYYTDVDIY